ncbi:mucin-2 [Achroia grisella]|uniref:mucin-2 n=1 Tax=Achroia grisella TaxID=688607 RepID=UPI0027D21B2D|nr:mucin-2 [Achroia grisella]
MDQRRAAGALLALTACIACTTAAPTANNQTALDLYDAATEGCYYNFQHYGEGDRIMTNEPCLNCTCHNRMLMCYLRVCPFTKPIGQDCTVEKRADQCCPIVTCPDVPVDLLTSTSTTSPAEYGATGLGRLDKYGCSINGRYFPEGSKVPPTPNKPCEHCYCIRNMTTCVMQECTLHVDGCTPIYHKDVCCPVRYSCDHPEDEVPLLDDMSTTVRPTPGFLLTTTTVAPVTQMTQDCIHGDQIFSDGTSIKTEKACEHCYCMKGDIVCVVQECGTPMENEGKNCTSQPPREGQCCPDTYICEGDEPITDVSADLTTEILLEELTTLSPPRRVSDEDNGYRNEPDEATNTEKPEEEAEIGSGDSEQATFKPDEDERQTALPSTITDNVSVIEHASTTAAFVEVGKVTTEPNKELNTVPNDIETSKPDDQFTSILDKDHEIPTHTTEPAYRKEDEDSSEAFLQNKDKDTDDLETTAKTTAYDVLSEKEITESPLINIETTKSEEANIVSTSETKPTNIVDSTEDIFRTTEPEDITLSETTTRTTTDDVYKADKDITKTPQSQKPTTESPIEMSTSIIETTKEDFATSETLPEISVLNVTKPHKDTVVTNEYKELTTSIPILTDVDESNESPVTDLASDRKETTVGLAVQTTPLYSGEPTESSAGVTLEQEVTTVSSSENTVGPISEFSKETAATDIVQDIVTPSIITELEKESYTTTHISSEEPTTVIPNKNEFATVDTNENEIGDFTTQGPGRIPGEGDCLLDGITYKNESIVPNSNKCQIECKCVSSIIKCDPIICSYPPEYMNSCVPTYDSPDACCPTYICDESHETIPPQAHSQMSGTESPVTIPTTECHGDQCDLQKEQKPHEPICSSDDGCSNAGEVGEKSDEVPTGIDQHVSIPDCGGKDCDNINQNVTPISTGSCIDGDCKILPTATDSLCQDENCKTSSTQLCANGEKCEESIPDIQKPCDGENCKISSSQPCADGEKCKEITTEVQIPCKGENCQTKPTPPCSDGNSCDETTPELQSPCEGENCKVRPTELCSKGEKCEESVPDMQRPCEGDDCKINISQSCSDGDECKVTAPETQNTCKGDNCKVSPTQLCSDRDKCDDAISDIPKPCEGENCKDSQTQICGDGEKCKEYSSESDCDNSDCNVPTVDQDQKQESVEDCAEESCRKQTIPSTENRLPSECTDSECDQQKPILSLQPTESESVPTTISSLEITSEPISGTYSTELEQTESSSISPSSSEAETEKPLIDTITEKDSELTTVLPEEISDKDRSESPEVSKTEKSDIPSTTESELSEPHERVTEQDQTMLTVKPDITIDKDISVTTAEAVVTEQITESYKVTKLQNEQTDNTEVSKYTTLPSVSETSDIDSVTKIPEGDKLITVEPIESITKSQDSTEPSYIEEKETEIPHTSTIEEAVTKYPQLYTEEDTGYESHTKPENIDNITEKDLVTETLHQLNTEKPAIETTVSSVGDVTETSSTPVSETNELIPGTSTEHIEQTPTEMTPPDKKIDDKPHYTEETELSSESSLKPEETNIEKEATSADTDITKQEIEVTTEDIMSVTSEYTKVDEYVTIGVITTKPEASEIPETEVTTPHSADTKSTYSPDIYSHVTEVPDNEKVDKDKYTTSNEISAYTTREPAQEEPASSIATEISTDKSTSVTITEDKSKIQPPEDIITETPEIYTEEPTDIKTDDLLGSTTGTLELDSTEYIPVHPSIVTERSEKIPENEPVTEVAYITEEPKQPDVISEENPDIVSRPSDDTDYKTSEITTTQANLEYETVSSDLEGSTARPDIVVTEQEDSYTKSPQINVNQEFATKLPVLDITRSDEIAESDVSFTKDESTESGIYSTTEGGDILYEQKEKVTKLPETLSSLEQDRTTPKDEHIVTAAEELPKPVTSISESEKDSTEHPESAVSDDLSELPENLTTPEEQKIVTHLPQELTTSLPIKSIEPSTTLEPSYIEEDDTIDVSKPVISKETESPQSHIKETEEHTTQLDLNNQPEIGQSTEREPIQPLKPTATTEKLEISEFEPEILSTERMSTEKPKFEDDTFETPNPILETDTTADIVELVEHTETTLQDVSTKTSLEEEVTVLPVEKWTTVTPGDQLIDHKYTEKDELPSEKPQEHDYDPESSSEKDLTTQTSISLETESSQKLDIEIDRTTSTGELLQESSTSAPPLQQTEHDQKQGAETSTPISISESEEAFSEKVTTDTSKIYEDKTTQPDHVVSTTEEQLPDMISEVHPSTEELPEKHPATTLLPVQFTNEIPTTVASTEKPQHEIYTTISAPDSTEVPTLITSIEQSLDDFEKPVEQAPDKIAVTTEADIITTIQPELEHLLTSTTTSEIEKLPTEITTVQPSIAQLPDETTTTLPIERLPPHEDATSTTVLLELLANESSTIQPSEQIPEETSTTILLPDELPHEISTTNLLTQQTEFDLKPTEASTSPALEIKETDRDKVSTDISSDELYITKQPEYEDTSHKISTTASSGILETEHDKELTGVSPTILPERDHSTHDAKPTENETFTTISESSSPSTTIIDKQITTLPSTVVEESTSSSVSDIPVIQEDIKKEEDEDKLTTLSPTFTTKEEQVTPIISDKVSTVEPEVDINLGTGKPVEFDHSHETTEADGEFLPASPKTTTRKTEEEEPTTQATLLDKTTKIEDKLSDVPSTAAPEIPKPGINEIPITDEVVEPEDHEDHEGPSASGGYGSDYADDDQPFGPGTCRYGGKVYVSAQQIPRDDPCDFCFCFRSDIICLQQSCPPPIHGCHEEPIQGFCCPRYECPVSMATALNVTTTTTTTTTTLPPHFLPHAYKGAAYKRGCQIKGHTYKVGEVVRASSGPCLHCTCGGDGQMKCDPKACTPEPMLRQMIAAAVSAKRRR